MQAFLTRLLLLLPLGSVSLAAIPASKWSTRSTISVGNWNMAPQTKHHEELLAAWRALAGHQESEGWRTIQVVYGGSCRFLAGRHFPGNEEDRKSTRLNSSH